MSRAHVALSVLTLFVCVAPAGAQYAPLYVRRSMPVRARQIPFLPQQVRGALPFEQQLAIAPVRYPAIWPAPRVPAGTILMVPPRPKSLPGPGEYWGPFTNEFGGWGFMVGPLPAPPPDPYQQAWPPVFPIRQRGAFTMPAPPPPPPAPLQPVAGPISPEGRMIVTYPDGGQVTWQFPMVGYSGRWNGFGTEGGLQITETSGRQRDFSLSPNVRFTLNGQLVDPYKVPPGTRIRARAMQSIPMTLTLIEFAS